MLCSPAPGPQGRPTASARPSPRDLTADSPARSDLTDRLVRLGRLDFDDFALLDDDTLRRVLCAPEYAGHSAVEAHLSGNRVPLHALALNNAPRVLVRIREANPGLAARPMPAAPLPLHSDILVARETLVRAFALELLRAKAPPLYDSLPWNEWDLSIIQRRFKLWQTRFLFAGEGTTVTACRIGKTAGAYAVEPLRAIAAYLERKAAADNVRRLRVITAPLARLPLPDRTVDLAVLGTPPPCFASGAGCVSGRETRLACRSAIVAELTRVASTTLIVENSPFSSPLDSDFLGASGFDRSEVEVRSLGLRPCWWRTRAPSSVL